jgi:hypothetical protein
MSQGDSRATEHGTASTSFDQGTAGGTENQHVGPGSHRLGGRTGPARPRSLLSQDQSWWWDGHRWVSATTADGLWAWNGRRWRTTVDLEGQRPEEMADTLMALAEDRYADAGATLVARVAEWEPGTDLQELVRLAESLAVRLGRVESELSSVPGRRGRGLRLTRPAESASLEPENAGLKAKQKTLLISIGRLAPDPTVKEADEIRGAARLLEERANLLQSALAGIEEAERQRAKAASEARERLAGAQSARRRAIRQAEQAVEQARLAHRAAIATARAGMRSVWRIPAGELKAVLGEMRMHANFLKTPQRVLPAGGLGALIGTAGDLWDRYRSPLIDLVVLERPETAAFLTAMLNRTDQLFVLFRSSIAVILWPCPEGRERDAERFVAVVAEQAAQAASGRDRRQRLQAEAEQHLATTVGDRSDIEAAEAALLEAESDHDLLAEVERAERHLEQVKRNVPELAEARQRLANAIRQVLTPPEALRTAGEDLE